MRPGLLIGFAVTVTTEFLVAWGGNLTRYHAPPKVKEEETKIEIAMPKYDPDPPEVVEGAAPNPERWTARLAQSFGATRRRLPPRTGSEATRARWRWPGTAWSPRGSTAS